MINLYNHIVDNLVNAAKIIQLKWFLSAVFFIVIIGLIISLNYIKNLSRIKERILSVYKKKYEFDLIEYLALSSANKQITKEQQIIIDYYKKCANSNFKRKLIIDTFLKLKNENSGEISDAIQKLYYRTDNVQYASKNLKSKKWKIVVDGIKELTQFEIKEVNDEVLKHVNHPRREVRIEIQRYLLKLFRFEGLEFLTDLKCNLPEDDQIQLLEILKNFEEQYTNNVSEWLESSNNSVVSFSLKLAKNFTLYQAKAAIIKLLFHSDNQIRIEAIEVMTYFGDTESLAILKEDFNNRYLNEQVAIFKMLENLYEINDIPFLLNHINTGNFYIKSSISKIFKAIDDNEAYDLKTLKNTIDYSENITLVQAS